MTHLIGMLNERLINTPEDARSLIILTRPEAELLLRALMIVRDASAIILGQEEAEQVAQAISSAEFEKRMRSERPVVNRPY